MTDLTLNDRVVVVTGAAGRLAGHILEALDQAGATVAALVLNDEEAQQVSLSAGSATFTADVTDDEQVREAFVKVRDRYGRMDVLIHTVGAWSGKPLLETTASDWDAMMRVNLTSAFLCFRESVRLMRPRETDDPPARLIGISSGQGADRGVAEQGAYAAAKAGIVRLVEAVAAEFEDEDITAHAIAPSLILYNEKTRPPDHEAHRAGVHARDLADLCLYLCTESAGNLNGSVVRAYGNRRP